MRTLTVSAGLLALSGCMAPAIRTVSVGDSLIEIQILAINDFHGNLETPPEAVTIAQPDGTSVKGRVGGAAQLASALARARQGQRFTITVAAGDLTGASPLTPAYFPDEATIDAMNMLGVGLASGGNHEFDKGSAELLRMQTGGCT